LRWAAGQGQGRGYLRKGTAIQEMHQGKIVEGKRPEGDKQKTGSRSFTPLKFVLAPPLLHGKISASKVGKSMKNVILIA